MGLSDSIQSLRGYKRFRDLRKGAGQIAFYSEMVSDRVHFESTLSELVQQHQLPVLYLTSYQHDPMLTNPPGGIQSLFIGNGALRTLVFMQIEAPVFVMTLPDLDRYHLKRSSHPVHYVYLFHSLVSTHMAYRHQAFDAYDTVLCAGPHHESEIREAERLFGLHPKQLLPVGYPRLDQIMRDAQTHSESAREKRTPGDEQFVEVLVAPSWGPSSISNTCLAELVPLLLHAGFRVTYRPHPMTLRQESSRIHLLISQWHANPSFRFCEGVESTSPLLEADVMISDWSGVAFEFGFGTDKPIVFVDLPPKCNHSEFAEFESVPVEVSIRASLGLIVSPKDLKDLPAQISNFDLSREAGARRSLNRDKLRNATCFHLGNSAAVGAQAIATIFAKGKTRTAGHS